MLGVCAYVYIKISAFFCIIFSLLKKALTNLSPLYTIFLAPSGQNLTHLKQPIHNAISISNVSVFIACFGQPSTHILHLVHLL